MYTNNRESGDSSVGKALGLLQVSRVRFPLHTQTELEFFWHFTIIKDVHSCGPCLGSIRRCWMRGQLVKEKSKRRSGDSNPDKPIQ